MKAHILLTLFLVIATLALTPALAEEAVPTLYAEQNAEQNTSDSCPFECSDGTCVDNADECMRQSCPSGKPILCDDGVCVESLDKCACRVRCYDGSCIGDLGICPNQACKPGNEYICPDGRCVRSNDDCRDIVWCPLHTPYQCPDGTCVKKEADCEAQGKPVAKACPESMSRCVDGTCVSRPHDCDFFGGLYEAEETPTEAEMMPDVIIDDEVVVLPDNQDAEEKDTEKQPESSEALRTYARSLIAAMPEISSIDLNDPLTVRVVRKAKVLGFISNDYTLTIIVDKQVQVDRPTWTAFASHDAREIETELKERINLDDDKDQQLYTISTVLYEHQ